MPDSDPLALADKSARLKQAIAEIEAEVVAEDGAVRVIAGPGGQIRKIDLGFQVFELSAAELGPIVAEALRAAERAAEVKTQSAVNDILGEQFTALSDQSKGLSE